MGVFAVFAISSCGVENISENSRTRNAENSDLSIEESAVPATPESRPNENFKNLAKDFKIELNCDRGVGLQYWIYLTEPEGLTGGLEYISDYVSASWNPAHLDYSATGTRSYDTNLNYCTYTIGERFLTRQFNCHNILLHQSEPILIYLYNSAGSELNCSLNMFTPSGGSWIQTYSKSLRIRNDGMYTTWFHIFSDSVEIIGDKFE